MPPVHPWATVRSEDSCRASQPFPEPSHTDALGPPPPGSRNRLRFDVQRPLDASTDQFVARLNAAAQREDEGSGDPVNPSDPNWLLGGQRRHRGSLHQDVWKGAAAELASRGFLAVYPAVGWWRTRPALERYGLPARYSLVVSIRTPQTNVDLYAAIAQKIRVANAVAVGT